MSGLLRTPLAGLLATIAAAAAKGPASQVVEVRSKPEPAPQIRYHAAIERHREPWRRKNRRKC